MEKWRRWAIISVIIALFSVLVGIWNMESITLVASVMALLFSTVSMIYCSKSVDRFSLIMSVVVLTATVLMATLTSYDVLVRDGPLSRHAWIYVSAAVHVAAVIPLIPMFYFTVAAVLKASYNWVIISGFSWLLGMGMLAPGYAFIKILQRADVDNEIITNANLVIGMMVNLVVLLAFALVLLYVCKRKYLITPNGLERFR